MAGHGYVGNMFRRSQSRWARPRRVCKLPLAVPLLARRRLVRGALCRRNGRGGAMGTMAIFLQLQLWRRVDGEVWEVPHRPWSVATAGGRQNAGRCLLSGACIAALAQVAAWGGAAEICGNIGGVLGLGGGSSGRGRPGRVPMQGTLCLQRSNSIGHT